MKKIIVMHFVSGLLSGGVEQIIYNYCKFLDHERYEFIVVYQHEAVQDCIEKIESISCRTIRITARNENFFKNIIDSYKLIKQYKPDIVHAHMNLMNFCALFPARLQKVKVRICHSHIAEKKRNIFYNAIAKTFKIFNIVNASDLMTCGEEAGVFMYGSKRMRSGKVELLENAIDLELFQRDSGIRNKIRNKLGCDDNTFLIGNIGRFTEQKNQKRLLKIFNEIYKQDNNTKLLLVGAGELLGECKKLAEELSIKDSVIFYGVTNNIKDIYNAIDVFALPSLYEGFPVVAIEVQAAKVPAVFSDSIAMSCKMTNLIEFLSLENSNEKWAKTILSKRSFDGDIDISKLFLKFDIRSNSKALDNYYMTTFSNNNKRRIFI